MTLENEKKDKRKKRQTRKKLQETLAGARKML